MNRDEISFCSFGVQSTKLIVDLSQCNMNSSLDPPPPTEKKKIIAVPSILYFRDNLDITLLFMSLTLSRLVTHVIFHVER